MFPNWAPAFAGVVANGTALIQAYSLPLFSREGGSPVWIPAFAGKQGRVLTA